MKNRLHFDFVVDKEKNTITIQREFAANRQLIWDCHTKSELLDQWFAPQPLTTKTKFMDFREGGHWLYGMVEPDGPTYWGRMDYLKINPIESYTGLDGFCDENGDLNPELPRAEWDVTFQDQVENSLVQTIVTYKSLEDLEAVIQMGLKDGLTSTMERLDDLLLKLA
ncbi:SRPBCC family protein [Dyadobacter pollutisoli]|uniref:SRPBCC domain-containing protein n=1 Tax=Dyadobacter pollutisoli TaxID=2910158 RepID=A0A9E8NHH2_9BACT|nr:SRPBCC domain-containing protein [Dyadobacter pollutisoli]WAC14741.1 SRPBCC domain-containing protein [Dyadobacter pollutisoli]